MRISDWSSDVCSSDLAYFVHSERRKRPFGTLGHDRGEKSLLAAEFFIDIPLRSAGPFDDVVYPRRLISIFEKDDGCRGQQGVAPGLGSLKILEMRRLEKDYVRSCRHWGSLEYKNKYNKDNK